jgi:subtilase family serine protease
VRSVSADRLALDVAGTSSRVEHAFDTTLAYQDVDGQRQQVAETNLSIPATLSGIVAGTLGLNETASASNTVVDGPTPSPAGPVVSKANLTRPPAANVSSGPCATFYGQAFSGAPAYGSYGHPLPDVVCGYTPAQIREAYGVAGLVDNGDNGTGQTVAVVDAYLSPTLLADVQTYAQDNDPAHPFASSQFSEIGHRFNERAECQPGTVFDEQTLDVEAVHAVAPGAHIVYVGAQNCNQGLYDALRKVVDDHVANVVSASWSDPGGDYSDDVGTRSAADSTLMMAAGTGVSVVFASGDGGDEFNATGVVSADYPASSPWATAVGGTTLEAGFGVGQWGWSTGRAYLCTSSLLQEGCSPDNAWLPVQFDGGSGGGTSVQYAQPAYQVGVVPASLAKRNSATPMRVEPDVAMDGDPDTGIIVGETERVPGEGSRYVQYRAGGTSLATPLFAGIVALADQQAGRSLGFLNPALYMLDKSQPSVFDDIRAGPPQAQLLTEYANHYDGQLGFDVSARIVDYEGVETGCTRGNCTNRDVALSPGPGYDNMTGLGAPTIGFVPALAKL